jgi:GMP synthase (glutamine-hydrolysing)
VKLKTVPAQERFLAALAALPDPADPEAKRKVIGREFIRVFEKAAQEVIEEQGGSSEIEFLVQGTLYPDVVESGGGEGAANIQSHHNVGGLPSDITFELIEPLRRRLHPQRRPETLASPSRVSLNTGLDQTVWQCPVVLLAEVRSVGVQGDGRTYGHPIVLRPVTSEDAMTADWAQLPYDLLSRISNRITNDRGGQSSRARCDQQAPGNH